VGLANFRFLFRRETFWMVVGQSLLFTVTAVACKTLLGFFLALQIHCYAGSPRCGQWM